VSIVTQGVTMKLQTPIVQVSRKAQDLSATKVSAMILAVDH
jgi:hypothetical protein